MSDDSIQHAKNDATTSGVHRVLIACGGTGGHLFPGIAVAQELKRQGAEVKLLISQKSVDAQATARYTDDLDFESVEAIAMPRLLSWHLPIFAYKLLKTYIKSRAIIKSFKPDVVLGMGGFTSLPPVLAGKRQGLKCYVHDSNAVPGRANRLTAKWCDKVLVGVEEATGYFPNSQVVVTGTPVRLEMELIPDKGESRERMGVPRQGQVVLVLGGSQGARHVTEVMIDVARATNGFAHFILLVGARDYSYMKERAEDARNLTLLEFCAEMQYAYAAADLVVARSGASTLTELAHFGKPALLVPYPFAADDHQTANALAYAVDGAAKVCKQADFTLSQAAGFVKEIAMHAGKTERMARAAQDRATPRAARSVAKTILEK